VSESTSGTGLSRLAPDYLIARLPPNDALKPSGAGSEEASWLSACRHFCSAATLPPVD
jgi:hypothetical protein